MQRQSFGINPTAVKELAKTIKFLRECKLEIGIVIGGGNIFRANDLKSPEIERTQADQMGMLATFINGIALQQYLECEKCPSKIYTALECPKVAETYTWYNAIQSFANGQVVIFVGGTGNPYFTTDTAAALRASEIHADILFKATKVDGVYTKDPLKYSDAIKYSNLTYSQMLAEKLEVMDATAIALCRSNQIPILVFNMKLLTCESAKNILLEKHQGTLITEN